jgi:hypothetical protein
MTDRVVMTIFIVITHLVVGGGERILDNLVGVLD